MTELFAEIERSRAATRAGLVARRAAMTLFAMVPALGLANVFGQDATDSAAAGPGASMTLSAPRAVRGGLFFQSRVEIRAHSQIQYPRLVLDEGWTEGLQVNSIEPAPTSESSRGGKLVLSYDTLAPGDVLRIWFQFEVDPTSPGKRSYGLELDDQTTRQARIDRNIRVFF